MSPDGDAVEVREMVPAKPLMLVRLIFEVDASPVITLMLVGAVIEKSTVFTTRVTV